MTIRTFQPGDEIAQVSIYNEAAASLPKFTPATVDEVRRRIRAVDFDPSTRFYAIEDGVPVFRVSLVDCLRSGRSKVGHSRSPTECL